MPSGLKEAVIVTEELEPASTEPCCVEVVTGNDNLEMKVSNIVSSQPGKKRKLPDEFESEVSSDKANDYDHSYFIRSPCRLRKVDDLIDQVESLKKKLKTSQKKACRLKKKLSSLMTV